LYYQGQIYLVAGTTLAVNTALGAIAVEYDIEFFDPGIEDLTANGVSVSTGNQTYTTTGSSSNPVIPASGATINYQNGSVTLPTPLGAVTIPAGTWLVEAAGLLTNQNASISTLGAQIFQNIVNGQTVGTPTQPTITVVPGATAGIFNRTIINVPNGTQATVTPTLNQTAATSATSVLQPTTFTVLRNTGSF
jgi:hypothetical protein